MDRPCKNCVKKTGSVKERRNASGKFSSAQKTSVHRFKEEECCFNLVSFYQNRSPVFSNFCEAEIFCYFLILQKVEEKK